jgi:putative phosphoesterase
MKIGIISDTHDHHQNVLKAIEIFNASAVEFVLHAGDMVSPFTARAFGKVKGAKLFTVFGNCDGEKQYLKTTIEQIGGENYGKIYKNQIAGKKIFMTHKPDNIDRAIGSGEYDLVIYGHTHKQDIRKAGQTLVINPGEATDWITGESFVVVLDLDNMSYESIRLN